MSIENKKNQSIKWWNHSRTWNNIAHAAFGEFPNSGIKKNLKEICYNFYTLKISYSNSIKDERQCIN